MPARSRDSSLSSGMLRATPKIEAQEPFDVQRVCRKEPNLGCDQIKPAKEPWEKAYETRSTVEYSNLDWVVQLCRLGPDHSGVGRTAEDRSPSRGNEHAFGRVQWPAGAQRVPTD